jgi:hypothetical protein
MNPTANYLNQIEAHLGESWLPKIYRGRLLKLRTRSYQFPAPAKHAKPEIHHTLLGIELKIGKHRLLCPDLATARYLAVFARIGCRAVAIPYDITKISLAADELESSWRRMFLLADELTKGRDVSFRTRLRRQLIGKVRGEIDEAGAGARVPEFKQITRQRIQPQKGTKSTRELGEP